MTEAALLAAILDAPEDDAPRLIYSDWLEEQGQDERAEFIKVQCAIAHTPAWRPTECDVCGNTSDETGTIEHGRGCHVVDEDGGGSSAADSNPVHESLRRRERELFEQLGANPFAWFPGVSTVAIEWSVPPARSGSPSGLLRRGFVRSITLSAADWLKHGDKIIAPVPLPEVILPSWQPVEEVTLTTWPEVQRCRSGQNVYQIVGRKKETPFEANHYGAMLRQGLLSAEWPRVKKWTISYSSEIGPPVTSDEIVEERFHAPALRDPCSIIIRPML